MIKKIEEARKRKQELEISRIRIALTEYGIKKLEVETQLSKIEDKIEELKKVIRKREELIGQ